MAGTDRGRAHAAHAARIWLNARAARNEHNHRQGAESCPVCSHTRRERLGSDVCDNPDCPICAQPQRTHPCDNPDCELCQPD